jgi:glutaredoxin
MKTGYVLLVVAALGAGLGAGYVFRHATSEKPGVSVEKVGGFEARYAASGSQVILYSLSTCGYCKQARELLEKQNVAYVEKVIDTSAAAKKEAAELGIKSVPVLLVGDYRVKGYDRSKWLDLLRNEGALAKK